MARRDKHAARFGSAYTLPRLERALAAFGVKLVPWQTAIIRQAAILHGRARPVEMFIARPRTMLDAARILESIRGS